MSVNIVKPVSVKELAYDNIKSRIINGDLMPGTRLLENNLADEMGISRPPLREAINLLEKDSFVKVLPRRGVIVSEIDSEDILSIWEARVISEPYAARLAAPYITGSEIEQLQKEYDYLINNLSDIDRYVKFDIETHNLPLKYVNNRFLRQHIENLREHSLRIRWNAEYPAEGRNEELQRKIMKEHELMINAYRKKDPSSAYRAVLEHIVKSSVRMVEDCNSKLSEEQQARLDYLGSLIK